MPNPAQDRALESFDTLDLTAFDEPAIICFWVTAKIESTGPQAVLADEDRNQGGRMAVQAGNLPLVGGELCLDFTNTAEPRDADQPHEFLDSYSGSISWSQHADILTVGEAEQLWQQAAVRQAEAVLRRALVLRETMYRLFSAAVRGQASDSKDLDGLNAVLPGSLARRRIIARAESFAWDWVRSDQALDWMLWPVVESAADLLTAGELYRLRRCAGCGWLFLDRSRNRSRRWCHMRVCGNRAKARRYYERQQGQTR